MSEQLRALLDDLDRQRAELLVLSAPLKAKRAELVAKIAPLEAELRDVNQKIKAIEQPKLGELLRSISGLETALGITGLRECCRDAANRQLVEKRDSITVEQCKVCGRRHHTIEADPIEVGVKGAPVG
jgi:uncharacterized coiled-coil DUF342 family protein